MLAARNRRLMWTAGTIFAMGVALGWGTPAGAVANPGEPTASECQIIAQQAVNKGNTFEAELAANGGGVCPAATVLGVTVQPAVVVVPASVPAAVLPKSGGNVTGPLTLASLAVLIGGALVIINRRRATPALTAPQTGPTIAGSLPPPVGVAPLLRAPMTPPTPWGPPTAGH